MILHGRPALLLTLLSVVCAAVLRISVAYLLCWLLTKCATRPRHRFALWTAYLIGSGFLWLFSLAGFIQELWFEKLPSAVPPINASPLGMAIIVPQHMALLFAYLSQVLLLLYGGTLVSSTIFAVREYISLRKVLRFRLEPPQPIKQLLHQVSGEWRAPRCKVWILPGIGSPATAGIFNPSIYLPMLGEKESAKALGDILCHELEHIKCRDSLWGGISGIVRLLLFFHPLIHRAYAAACFERELACDLAVVSRSPEHRDIYAETLLSFAWRSARAEHQDLIGVGFMSNAGLLSARIRFILSEQPKYSVWSHRLRGTAGALLLWVVVAVTPAVWIVLQIAMPTVHAETSSASIVAKAPKVYKRAARKLNTSDAPTDTTTALPVVTDSSPLAALATHVFIAHNAEELRSKPAIESQTTDQQSSSSRETAKSDGPKEEPESTADQVAKLPPFGGSSPMDEVLRHAGISTSNAPSSKASCAHVSISASPQNRSRRSF